MHYLRNSMFLLLLSPIWLGAEERLSLSEAMQRAREKAGGMVAAQAREEAAQQRVRQAKGFRLPSLRLEENFIRTDSPAEAFALKLNQERFSFADFTTSNPNNPSMANTAVTRLELSLPIYTGGEIAARIGQAEAAGKAATNTASWTGNEVAWEAAKAYVDLAAAQEYVRLLEDARKTVFAHVEQAKNYVEQGMLVRSELLRAEVELSRVDDLLVETKGQAHVAAANLAFRIGAEQSRTWELEPLKAPVAGPEELSTWLASASLRFDLQAAQSLLRAGELEMRVRRAAFLPKFGVIARRDFVDDRVFGRHGDSTSLLGQVSVNLFAGGSDRAALRAAEWDAKAGRADVESFRAAIELQVRQAWEAATTAIARRATAMQAVGAAREAERIVSERFAIGVVKIIDVLDVATARREAETRELVARTGACEALFRLALLAGRRPETMLQ